MKPDMDLMRRMVLKLRDSDTSISEMEDVAKDDFLFHADLMIRKRLAEGNVQPDFTGARNIPVSVLLRRLTPAGHDLADKIEDDTAWNRAKEHILKPAGLLSIQAILQYFQVQITGTF